MPHAEKGSVAAGIIQNSTVAIINGNVISVDEIRQREAHYLTRVIGDCGGLEWLSLIGLQDDNSQGLALDAVYTALLTTSTEAALYTRKIC